MSKLMIATTTYINEDLKNAGLSSSSTLGISELAQRRDQHRSNKKKNNILHDPWIHIRRNRYLTWFVDEENGGGKLKENADSEGPILDFVVAGWPKTGTTTLEANLGRTGLAPMPIADVCTPVHQQVYYAYVNWPREYGNVTENVDENEEARRRRLSLPPFFDGKKGLDPTSNFSTIVEEKPLRGTKCPKYVHNFAELDKYLPRTKMIVGIRHPVLWFQSFWNMLAGNDKQYTRLNPYNKTSPCVAGKRCSNFCPGGQILCMYRAQFHVGLAALGKTNMTDDERKLLAPGTPYAEQLERNVRRVRNPIFVYEQTTMRNESFWDDLADYLNVSVVPHDLYHSSHGAVRGEWSISSRIDVCDPRYDEFRRLFMPIAYDVSEWLLHYFIPVALDPDRPDVVVADVASFREIVLDYRNDPCHRLVRNHTDGTYYSYNHLPSIQY
eukprot:scaffold11639_cov172-Amphora_coffeaeformis.AAC.1